MKQSNASKDERVEVEGAAPRSTQVAAICAFVLVNLTVPVLIGELFPFSSSPMLRDKPESYCEYKVFSLTENEYKMFDSGINYGPSFISTDGHLDFGLQQIYNGNPVGLGVGVKPPRTVNNFGEVASEAEVRKIVEANLLRMKKKGVRVQQLVYGAVDDQHVGQLRSSDWIIEVSNRDASADNAAAALQSESPAVAGEESNTSPDDDANENGIEK